VGDQPGHGHALGDMLRFAIDVNIHDLINRRKKTRETLLFREFRSAPEYRQGMRKSRVCAFPSLPRLCNMLNMNPCEKQSTIPAFRSGEIALI
jgi:hypothetical protein